MFLGTRSCSRLGRTGRGGDLLLSLVVDIVTVLIILAVVVEIIVKLIIVVVLTSIVFVIVVVRAGGVLFGFLRDLLVILWKLLSLVRTRGNSSLPVFHPRRLGPMVGSTNNAKGIAGRHLCQNFCLGRIFT